MALTNAEKQARYRARRAAAFARLEAENAALRAELDLLRGRAAATGGEFRSRAARSARTAAHALLASLEEAAPDHAAHLRGRLADPPDALILEWLAAGAEIWLWDTFWLTATAPGPPRNESESESERKSDGAGQSLKSAPVDPPTAGACAVAADAEGREETVPVPAEPR